MMTGMKKNKRNLNIQKKIASIRVKLISFFKDCRVEFTNLFYSFDILMRKYTKSECSQEPCDIRSLTENGR